MALQLADKGLLKGQAYVNGQWIDADSGETVAVTNPVNGETVMDIARCGQAETRRAIEAAEAAQGQWRRKPAKERATLLRN